MELDQENKPTDALADQEVTNSLTDKKSKSRGFKVVDYQNGKSRSSRTLSLLASLPLRSRELFICANKHEFRFS
jgi:hypothetical protein